MQDLKKSREIKPRGRERGRDRDLSFLFNLADIHLALCMYAAGRTLIHEPRLLCTVTG